ncbi:IS21 family transposase [Clostridium cadaveris]|uniref:Transposase n=1 Tax=Clostridium cadaveris TaxID=1529 RepID=A0A1I2JVS4_9CLOT|nr:IS21 family transposase [Clostridium cadaveris]MDM8310489.1 IS21 family transposase [Clostridium cadaveris]MDY4949223.1 IS21 family transposase [Clostridium cadaveris]NME64650.1 IS21 family transposase [Clostridium cadaveris]UFH63799.1 IS21 family transposase [Clostridium cadaveris]SFF58203.1 Transposase [Clostridium cadaveris]
MKDVKDWITVKTMHRKGIPIRQIARELKISRNTVKRLIQFEEEPKYKKRDYSTKVDDYLEKIKIWYLDPEYNFIGTRIYRELKKLGYNGSISPVYRYLNTLKEDKSNLPLKATKRIETPLGDQAQFDWAHYIMNIASEKITVYCFSLILSASRKKAIIFSKSCDGEAIYDSIYLLFKKIGGVTKELLIDNPKALVNSNKSGDEVDFNTNALRLSHYLGIHLNACNPYRARTKGKVEKPFQYIEEQFVKGSKFNSMTELNEAADIFIEESNNLVHSTTLRLTNEFFAEEVPHLTPIRTKPFIICDLKERKVSLDSYISVEAVKYSVPVEYVGKKVSFRISLGYKLEIFNAGLEIIATHEIIKDKGKMITIDEHYGDLNNIAPKSIPEIIRQFENIFSNGQIFYKKCIPHLKQPSYHLRQIIKLKELYDIESLDLVLKYCIEKNIYEISGIKDVLKTKYFDIVKGISSENELLTINETSRDLSYYEEDQF